MMLRRAINRGEAAPVGFRMPYAPLTSWLTLGFLLMVLVLMAFDYPNGSFTVAALPFVLLLLALGWRVQKGTHPFSVTAPLYTLTKIAEEQEDSRAP